MHRHTQDLEVSDDYLQATSTADERGASAQWAALTLHGCFARRRASVLGAHANAITPAARPCSTLGFAMTADHGALSCSARVERWIAVCGAAVCTNDEAI